LESKELLRFDEQDLDGSAEEMNTDLMFSTGAEEWETPPELFKWLDDYFHFTLDVCASEKNTKCKDFYSREHDAFIEAWTGKCYMNPPYGRGIGKWIKFAWEQSRNPNTTIVCLLPARTDTKWFHEYCTRGTIIFLKGRLTFVGAESPAPYPSMIVIFGSIAPVRDEMVIALGCEPMDGVWRK